MSEHSYHVAISDAHGNSVSPKPTPTANTPYVEPLAVAAQAIQWLNADAQMLAMLETTDPLTITITPLKKE